MASRRTTRSGNQGANTPPSRAGARKAASRRGETKRASRPQDSNGRARGAGKRAGAKPRRPARRAPKRHAPAFSNEAASLLVLVLGLLLFVFVYIPQAGGIMGGTVRSWLLGSVGMGAYVLPFALVLGGVKGFFSGEGMGRARTGLMALLFLCLITFWAIPSVDTRAYFGSVWEYISFYFSGGSLVNGGLIGASVANLLMVMMGTMGSYVLILATALVLAAYLSKTSLASIAGEIGERLSAYDFSHRYYDEDQDEYDTPEDEEDDYIPEELARLHRQPRRVPRGGAEAPRRRPRLFTIEGGAEEPQDSEQAVSRPAVQEQTITILRGEEGIVGLAEAEDDTPPFDLAGAPAPQPVRHGKPEGAAPESEPSDIVIKENTNKFIDITGGAAGADEMGSGSQQHIPFSQSADEEYAFPPIDILRANPNVQAAGSRASILENSRKLEETLKSFGVEARVVEVSKGPTVTRYELSPGTGVKVSRISALADDLALNLAAVGIRIEAPIPGKAAVGIEIPNKEIRPVHLREVIEDEAFKSFPSKLAFALGKDIAGNTIVADIAKMPHLLIAGATGSGKSVCINTLVTSIIYKATPNEVKLLMIDPKVVELSVYNGIPHLLIPVVTDPKKAAGALFWAVQEMVRRYNLFAETAVRDLKGYNAILAQDGEEPLPQIVIIIDELADLMMVAPGDVEDSICRLAQMARAAGLHLIIATQRPSVDVITGLIKANVPSRLAFAVSSGTDSRTILDQVGAERLLGKGDMLFNPVGLGKPQRIQGAFISDKEVEMIVSYIKREENQGYDDEMIDKITQAKPTEGAAAGASEDELFDAAAQLVISKEKASASMLQRQFRIGYNRASRLVEELEEKGIVGPEDGAKARKVLMNAYQWQEYKGSTNA